MTALSRRAFLAGAAGAAGLALVGAPAGAPAGAATRLDYRKGLCVPGYAGRGLLFAPEPVMREQVDSIAALGIGWLRTDLVAQQVSWASDGSYDWSAFDRLFGYARSKGVKILACLQGQCSVDGEAPSQPRTAAARARVADLAAAAAVHFGPRINALEVGNEVNTSRFWTTPSVREYGSLLAAVHTAVKRRRPRLTVLSAGTGGSGGSHADVATLAWYRKLYRGGYGRYFDAVAVHPYSGFTTRAGRNEEAHLKPLRALMNAHGDRRKRIWGTETGAPTGGSYAVSEADQAVIVANSWAWFRKHSGARGPLFFYTLEDFAMPGSSEDAESYFGLRRADGTEKPAHDVVKNLR